MAKSIMIQGTMSNVGKSLLTAAICRILKQDGYRVAPFKSQNMALNSYITQDGLEMGRAQVMQAEASGITPSVWMNPILLKPTTDVGSQVIVNGRVVGNMTAADYFQYKSTLVPVILKAYQNLAETNDVIVIEGAGSPAEINLKSRDIVNMGLAQLVQAPVLLVGDIDRGGVFAQLYGTMALLEPEEKAHVKGLVVNKFRGDRAILEPGLRQLADLCGVPVAGVVPYLYLDIDDEDSLSDRFSKREKKGLLDVAVIRFPRISNFTDCNPLERLETVSLRYVTKESQLGQPDLILLPGTKSTMADLRWLRESGLETAIQKLAGKGTAVLGICGGYQMLGESLSDPDEVEGGGAMRGMGLLPVHTVFQREKTRTQAVGKVLAPEGVLKAMDGRSTEGYEIHCGKTETAGKPFLALRRFGSTEVVYDGCQQGNVYGTYLHGLLDAPAFTDGLVGCLLAAKGIAYTGQSVSTAAYKEQQYDRLAAAVRSSMDMDFLYQIIEKGMGS